MQSMQIRITKTMVSALLNTDKSLATHYGAVVCLHRLGLHVVDAILLDNVKIYRFCSKIAKTLCIFFFFGT